MEGTSLIRFRRQFIDRLAADVTNVSYQAPTVAEDMLGSDGSGAAVWWSDDVEADATVDVMVGAGHVWYDERYVATLRIQGLGLSSDDDQYVCDQRANDLLGHVLALLGLQGAAGYQLDLDTTELEVFDYTLDGWKWTGGLIGTANKAARFEVRIAVHARVKIGAA